MIEYTEVFHQIIIYIFGMHMPINNFNNQQSLILNIGHI